MNLQQLYYFRAIAELEHFTKAADRLLVSQPSLSHSISDLEQELGVALFERVGRNVRLTNYGSMFFEYVVDALDTLEEGKRKLSDCISKHSGTIALAYFSSMEAFIPYLVSRFFAQEQGPQNVFHFFPTTSHMIESSLLDGSVDLALTVAIDDARLRYHRVGEHNMTLIVPVSHPLASQDSVDLSALGDERFITYNYQTQIRTHVDNIFQRVGINPSIVCETTHDQIIYSSVAANFGIALVPEALGIHPYNVKELQIENDIPPRDIFLCWKDVRYTSPAVKNFRSFIIKSGEVLDIYRLEQRKLRFATGPVARG